MKALRFPRLFAALAAASLLASPLQARDLYRHFLDPAIPHHRAILDTVERMKADPTNGDLHNDLGCLVAWDGFWRDALREFGEAASLNKKDSRPLFNAGLVRAWKGEWGGSQRSFRRAVDRDPGNWNAWWMLGFAEERLGNVEKAVDAYKTSLRVNTSLFDVKTNPFAAQSRLKARVLLETYDKRIIRAVMPRAEQLADPARVAMVMQLSKPVPQPAPVVVEREKMAEPEESPVHTGPVVSTVPSSAPSAAPAPGSTRSGSTSSPPASPSQPSFKYAAPRSEGRAVAPPGALPPGKTEPDAEMRRRLHQSSIDGVDPDRVAPAPGATPTPTPAPKDN